MFSSTCTRFQPLEKKSFLFLFCIFSPQFRNNYKTHYWRPNLLSPSWWLNSYAYRANILKLWALFNILIAVLLCFFCYWKGFQWVLFWGSIQIVKHIFKIESDKIGVLWVCEWEESILCKYILQYCSIYFLVFFLLVPTPVWNNDVSRFY